MRSTATHAPTMPRAIGSSDARATGPGLGANGIGVVARAAPAATPRPTPRPVETSSSTRDWARLSRSTYQVLAPIARSTAISGLRWMVSTVKKAPTTSAEMA